MLILGGMDTPEHIPPCDDAPGEKVERLLDDLEFRVKQIERDRMSPEELEHEMMLHQLEEAGFTKEQATVLANLVRSPGFSKAGALGRLYGVLRRQGMTSHRVPHSRVLPPQKRLFDPDFSCDEDCDDCVPLRTPGRMLEVPPHDAFKHASFFSDPFVLLSLAAIGIGTFGMVRDRIARRHAPPPPWWQRQLQKLVGVA